MCSALRGIDPSTRSGPDASPVEHHFTQRDMLGNICEFKEEPQKNIGVCMSTPVAFRTGTDSAYPSNSTENSFR